MKLLKNIVTNIFGFIILGIIIFFSHNYYGVVFENKTNNWLDTYVCFENKNRNNYFIFEYNYFNGMGKVYDNNYELLGKEKLEKHKLLKDTYNGSNDWIGKSSFDSEKLSFISHDGDMIFNFTKFDGSKVINADCINNHDNFFWKIQEFK